MATKKNKNIEEKEIASSSTGSVFSVDEIKKIIESGTKKTDQQERLGNYFEKIGLIGEKEIEESFNEIVKVRTGETTKKLDDIKTDYEKKVDEINENFANKFIEFEKTLLDSKDKLESKIENSKLSIIETLGIFVALFTFISVDFQVFKSYRDPMAISALTAILIGAIFLFIVVFDYFILQARKVRKTEENTDSKKYIEDGRASWVRRIIFGVSLVLIFLGIFIFSKTTSDENFDMRDQIRKEILNSVQLDLDNQKNELEKINDNNGILIKSTNDSIVKFKECVKNFGFTYKCFE